jgi:hypothetical protein
MRMGSGRLSGVCTGRQSEGQERYTVRGEDKQTIRKGIGRQSGRGQADCQDLVQVDNQEGRKDRKTEGKTGRQSRGEER